jgi:hypothetical protein
VRIPGDGNHDAGSKRIPEMAKCYADLNGYAGLADLYARAGKQKLACRRTRSCFSLSPAI